MRCGRSANSARKPLRAAGLPGAHSEATGQRFADVR
jgi:hypothetical protein